MRKADKGYIRRGCEVPSAMTTPVRTNKVNQVIRHPRTTFGAVVLNVNKRPVPADARTFTPNYVLGVDLFIFKRTDDRDSTENLLVISPKV